MEVSFKFNNGETGQEMVAAILALFGASAPAAITIAQPATLAHADNPATGAEPDDTGAASTAQFDAEGSPWDARIHSDKRTMTDKNVWRKRKGTPPHTIAAVQAELKQTGKWQAAAAQAPVAPSAPPAAAQAPVAPPAAPVVPTLPTAQPLPVAAAPALPPAAPVETPYTKLALFLASHTNSPANPAGRLTAEYISQCLTAWGYPTGMLQSLEHDPADRIAAVHQAFAQALGVAV